MRAPMFTESQIQEMKNSYAIGTASLSSLSKEYGASVPTISKYLRTAGVQIRGRGRPRKDAEPTPTIDYQFTE